MKYEEVNKALEDGYKAQAITKGLIQLISNGIEDIETLSTLDVINDYLTSILGFLQEVELDTKEEPQALVTNGHPNKKEGGAGDAK